MRRLSFGLALIAAVALALAVSCGDGENDSLRNATENDLPNMVLQAEDVPRGSRAVDDSSETGGALATYSVSYDFLGGQSSETRLSEIHALAAMYASDDAAAKYVTGPGQIPGLNEIPGGKALNVQDLGERAVAYVSECQSDCPPDHSPLIVILFQQGNVLSIISAQANREEAAVDEAIEYARKQALRVDAILRSEE